MKLSHFISTNFALLAFHNAAFALKTDHALPRDQDSDEAGVVQLNALMVGARGVGKTTIAKAWYDEEAQKDEPQQDPTSSVVIWPFSMENEEEGEENLRTNLVVSDLSPYSADVLINTDHDFIMGQIYKANVVVIVFDITRPKTLQDALDWKQELEKHTRVGVDFIWLANKMDEADALGVEHITNKETGFGNFFTEDDLVTMNLDESLAYNWATVLLSFCARRELSLSTTGILPRPLIHATYQNGFSISRIPGYAVANGLPVSANDNWGMDESFEYVYAAALDHYESVDSFQLLEELVLLGHDYLTSGGGLGGGME